MAPNVDDIIQTTTAEDVLDDSYSGSSSYDDYDLDDFDLDNYDSYLDDYDLDSFDTDDYLDDYDLDDYNSDDYLDDNDSGDSDDLYSGGSDDYDIDSSSSSSSVGYVNYKIWYIAAAAIQGVGLLAFFVLLLVTLFACLRRNDGTKPAKSIAVSLVFFILWSIFQIVTNVSYTSIEIGQDAGIAIYILAFFWLSVAHLMIFFIFYRLLNDRFNRLASTSAFHKFVKLFHWGLLGLLSILFVVRIILNIVVQVKRKNYYSDMDPKLEDSFAKFYGAVDIIAWLAALEILACSIIALVQTRSSLGGSIASPIALIIAAFALFIDWLVAMIISIRFYLMAVYPPDYLIIPQTVFAIACPVVMYIAFILIIAKSDRWETPKNQPVQPQEPVQYQQPMGETQYEQMQSQYAPAPGTSPVPYQQPAPPPQQFPGTPPPQTQYAQPQAEYAQPQPQYAQVPVPAAYPSQSPHPQ